MKNFKIIIYTNTFSTKTLIASWGGNNNRLYRKVTDSGAVKIVGFGRATTFNDAIGQRDHVLIKGDVATQRDHDDCKYGLTVKVTATKKGSTIELTKSMVKRDIGRMDNAIVDIWKTGVEYWGYTYSSYLSLSGEVKMVHANEY